MSFSVPRLRWWIAGFLCLLSVLNYTDRQALALLIPTIQAELHLTDAQYANVVSLFLIAYALAYLFSGRIVDYLGARLSLVLFLAVWATADFLTGLARSMTLLAPARFLLGLGEAGGYLVSPKVVAEWFPSRERGVAVGFYSVGSSLGATLAPLLVIALATRYGWRAAFFTTGTLALVVAATWFLLYREPRQHPLLSERERALLPEKPAPGAEPPLSERARWGSILCHPAVWTLAAARMLTDPVWYFYIFWLPKYLHSVRGFDQHALAGTWKLFLAADFGFLMNGLISGWLIRRGRPAPTARLSVMLVCAALVPFSALIPFAPGLGEVFAVGMVVAFAHTAWLGSLSTYIIDLIPPRILGTAFGFIGAGSALGGILMNQAVAWTISRGSYAPCFYAMIVLHPLAFALICLFGRRPWERETLPPDRPKLFRTI